MDNTIQILQTEDQGGGGIQITVFEKLHGYSGKNRDGS